MPNDKTSDWWKMYMPSVKQVSQLKRAYEVYPEQRERLLREYPWLEYTFREKTEELEPVSPWMGAFGQLLKIPTAAHELSKAAATTLAAPFVKEIPPIKEAPLPPKEERLLETPFEAYEKWEAPWGVKGALEEVVYLPLYAVGLGVAPKAVQTLTATVLKRVEQGLAKVAKGRMPSKAERAAMQALRTAGGKAGITEEELLKEAYGTLRLTTKYTPEQVSALAKAQIVKKAVPPVAKQAVERVREKAKPPEIMKPPEKLAVPPKITPAEAETMAEQVAVKYGKKFAGEDAELVDKVRQILVETPPLRGEAEAATRRLHAKQWSDYGFTYRTGLDAGLSPTEARIQAKAKLGIKREPIAGAPAEQISKDEVDRLYKIIDRELADIEKPKLILRDAQRENCKEGLDRLLATGDIPAKHELVLLEEAFGVDFVADFVKSRLTLGKKALTALLELANTPRSILASFDLSATLRQGGLLLPSRPKESGEAFVRQIKALASETNALTMNDIQFGRIPGGAIKERAQLRLQTGLFLHDLRGGAVGFGGREEAFISGWLQRFAENYGRLKDWQKIITAPAYPLAKGVQLSERAYATYLNTLRCNVWDVVVDGWAASGKNFSANDMITLSKQINVLTGRGMLRSGEYPTAVMTQAGKEFIRPARALPGTETAVLNLSFFSPRFQASRLQLPFLPLITSPAVKKVLARDIALATGTAATILTLASLHPDIDVEADPRSTDFGKLRIGDTRIDFLSGFQPYIRYSSQLFAGKRKTTTGRIQEMTPTARLLTGTRAISTKFSPMMSMVRNAIIGQNIIGEPVTTMQEILGGEVEPEVAQRELFDQLAPMYIQALAEAIEEWGWAEGVAISATEMLGTGTMTYDSTPQAIGELRTELSLAQEAQKKVRELTEKGRWDKVWLFIDEHPEWRIFPDPKKGGQFFSGTAQQLSEANSMIAKYNDFLESLEQDETLTEEQKFKEKKEIERAMIQIAIDTLLALEGFPTSKELETEEGRPSEIYPQLPE